MMSSRPPEHAELNVVHTIPGLRESAGGVSRSVPGLCEALARQGCRTFLVSQRIVNAPEQVVRVPDPSLVETRLVDGYDWNRLRFSFTPGLDRALESVCKRVSPCVLHDHGVWLHLNHAVARVSRRLGAQRVVSPRGMLEGWSLNYRGWKKNLAWHAYQGRDLRDATAFCATSAGEAESIRALGFTQPIAIIPNGVDVPQRTAAALLNPAQRTVLFMSRIHPKKGLLDLVAAWAATARTGWRLVIAGPDEGNHRREVEAAIRDAGVGAHVEFAGAVEGGEKERLLGSADLFVLPSYSENFGIVVGEALAHGLPVITTNVTPWQSLLERKCGWWVDPGVKALTAALGEAMTLTADQRHAMGQNGRRLIEEQFSWSSVAERHVEMYRWLLWGTTRPCWIDT